jgi:hypothetical protein
LGAAIASTPGLADWERSSEPAGAGWPLSPAIAGTKGRLLDRVVAGGPSLSASTPSGRRTLAGVGVHAGELRAVRTRYMLDPETSDWCAALVLGADQFLLPDNPFLRLPAEAMWLEWFDSDSPRRRHGHYVRAEVDGRRGVMTAYWEREGGLADLCVADVLFDLDAPLARTADQRSRFSFRHDVLRGLDPLFRHCVAVLRPDWRDYLRLTRASDFDQVIRQLVGALWFHLPQTLAFAALLSSKRALRQRPSELGSLNDARRRRGKPALLDHVEVKLALGEGNSGAVRAGLGAGTRSAPRLHYVRGHRVTRAGRTFWRAPHLRGDVTREGPVRNVTVVAR